MIGDFFKKEQIVTYERSFYNLDEGLAWQNELVNSLTRKGFRVESFNEDQNDVTFFFVKGVKLEEQKEG